MVGRAFEKIIKKGDKENEKDKKGSHKSSASYCFAS